MKRLYQYIIVLLIVCCATVTLNSCADEVILPAAPSEEEYNPRDDAYTLNFVVTVDEMGSRSTYNKSDDPVEITKWENYIDLERFRVLFFGEDDKFLFESKNRWVKQINASDNFSSWYVSVPLGAFGNDSYGEGQEYDWDAIRTYLTTHRFKIAILANRPAQLLYPGFIDSELSLEDGVFDNDGPYWGPDQAGVRTLFDLHHYQYDIIYTDKGEHGIKSGSSYYDFVMDDIDTDRPKMGAAINWVSFDNGDTDKTLLSGTNYMRNIKMPSANHPIPMYGVQIFDHIPPEAWKKGTPFDISNLPVEAFPDAKYDYQSISLLRCCVRLDLKIPKSVMSGKQPVHVSLWYSNIYSRTEPMDNWTPTDQLWNQDGFNHSDSNCELQRLIDYGPVVTNSSPGNGTTKALYQQRLKWFYGAWLDKGWDFYTIDGGKSVPTETIKYPRIFNACIQRNKVIQLNYGDVTNYYPDKDAYWHYIVYTGERSPNDVNSLPNMPSNPYIACFVISWDNKKFYCIPLLNYNEVPYDYYSAVFGPHSDGTWANASPCSAYNTFINSTVPQNKAEKIPYPLLRNHIYKFTLKGTRSADGNDLENIHIDSEVRSTPDINYSGQVKTAKIDKRMEATGTGTASSFLQGK